jgi:hypothetical protein
MVKIKFWLYVSCLLLAASPVYGQAIAQGTVVRVIDDGLVFIDLGSDASVIEGDFFNIVSNEIVYHPLNPDSVLVTTPMEVGVLQAIQVYPKMALAKLIHIQDGEDPMLKQVTRVSDPERLVEAEIFVQQQMRGSLGGISRRSGSLTRVTCLSIGSSPSCMWISLASAILG